jgi:hypothetical protein
MRCYRPTDAPLYSDDIGVGLFICQRPLHHAQVEATDLMPLERFRIETSSVIKHQNVKRHPHQPDRLPVNELNDSLR